eukprot:TRINITY_DN16779_c0_g2_i1.p1 TRINITY_DN16779_c0_g2~~TRINITY_DN16779_c0_g2_i1.p1  ORF type:complete len:1538 (+),score=695.46 TRINITY_DN16779_c0_g2_i1:168-4616(+)
MGNCACGEKKPKRSNHISADQQAKINETSHQVKTMIKEDVKAAVEEAAKMEEEAEEAEKEGKEPPKPEEKKAAKRRAKKAKKRATKLETLERARKVEAMTLNDYNTAIRRLQSVTGEDPTNPGMKITLPEGLEWMTAMLEVLWPSIRNYCETTFRESLQDMTSQFVEWYGMTCQLEEFKLGESSPGFGPISARKVHGIDGKPDGGIEISLGITYRSDMILKMKTSGGDIGIRNLDFLGTLFIWLRPFVDDMPLVGGVEMAFVNPPTLELDWTGFTGKTLELAGLKGKVRGYINDFLGSWMLVPNMITIPMHPKVDVAKLKCPPPEGIMRLHILGAVNLPGTDWGGGIDPYIEVRVGAQTYKSKKVKNSACPEWNETHDFLVYNQEQWVSINVYESDVIGNDLIGSVLHLPVNRLCKRHIAEVPLTKDGLPLVGEDDEGDEAPPCRLRLRAEWVAIRDDESASGERMVSVHLAEITNVPENIHERKPPYKVRATVGKRSQETWGGSAKPGSYMDTEDMIKLIRKLSSEQSKSVGEIQQITRMTRECDEKYIKQALEKKGGTWAMSVDDSDKAWWKKRPTYLNWQAFPDEGKAEKDERIKWAGRSEDQPLPLASKEELKARKKHFEMMHTMSNWHTGVMWSLMAKSAADNPYYEHVLHINSADAVDQVTLTVLDSANKEVGATTLTVSDSKQGDEADLEGPFDIPINGTSHKLQLHGDITVKALVVTNELPANWNLKADSLDTTGDFVEWWKDEVYHDDWSYNKEDGKKWCALDWPRGKKKKAPQEELDLRVKYYQDGSSDTVEGSGAQPVKKAALEACLRSGSITWGDYDVMMGKLLGEKDQPTIAETLEWVNLLIQCLWPSIKTYATNQIREEVEPMIKKAAAQAGESLQLASLDIAIPKVELGTKPPFFNTIQVEKIRRPQETNWGGVWEGMVVTLNNLTLASDIDMEIRITLKTALGEKAINLGAKNVLFRGTIKAKFAPMLKDLPMVGAIQVTMPNPPDLEVDFTGLTDVVDKLPGMNSLVCGTVVDNVASYVAAPNFIVVPLDPQFNSIELNYPKPIGVLRLRVDSAHHLMAGDVSITGAKNSDSYVKLRVGGETYNTATVTSLDPVWTLKNQHDFVVHDEDQAVDIEVFDADGLLGGADDSLGAVHSKETVLGGGIDLIRRGIPVRALLRLGAKGCLRLSRKQKDEVSSTDTHIVYEDIPIKGEDGQESKIIITASWLNILSEGESKDPQAVAGSRYLAYLLQVQVDAIGGLPYPVEAGLGSPFRVKASVGIYSTTGKPGLGKPSQVDPAGLLKMVRKLNSEGSSVNDISKTLELGKDMVEKGIAFTPEQVGTAGDDDVVEWCASAPASILSNRAATAPQFLQRLHLIVPIDRDDEAPQLGRWKAPVQLALVNANDEEISTLEILYDVATNFDAETSTAAVIEGPFTFDVNYEGKAGGGLLSYVGMAGAATDSWNGKVTMQGSVVLEGLKQRIMDAD